jgi:hypothetical protein
VIAEGVHVFEIDVAAVRDQPRGGNRLRRGYAPALVFPCR